MTEKLQGKIEKIKQIFIRSGMNDNLKSWMQIAEEKQEFYCSTLGTRTWEEYKKNEKNFLKIKLGFAIFGPESIIVNNEMCFKEPIQEKIIQNIVNIIEKIRESENILLAFFYVIGNVDGEYAEFPLIRVFNSDNLQNTHDCFFIDILGRVYKNWDEFLQNNIFPKCMYCYPKDGFYSKDKEGKVQLDYGYSPASKKLKRFARGLDKLSDVAMIGTAAICITSMAIPIAAPVLLGTAVAGVSSGVWTTARSTTSLVDRKNHGQPIGLTDQDARAQWLSLVSGILGAAGAGAMHFTQLAARSGQVLGKVPGILVSAIETGSGISSGGLYIINQVMRLIQNKDFNASDIAQLALSILFFFHAQVDTKTITKLLLQLQKEIMANLKQQINSEEKNIFEFILREGRKQKITNESQVVVKSLRVIDSCFE